MCQDKPSATSQRQGTRSYPWKQRHLGHQRKSSSFSSCNGHGACKGAASDGGFIDTIENSCNAEGACELAARNNGVITSISSSSCNHERACASAAENDGFIDIIENSCNAEEACLDTGSNNSNIISISSMCNVGGACKGATSTEQVVATIDIFKDDDDSTEQVVSISTDTFEEDVVKVEDDVEEEKEYTDPYVLGVPEAEIVLEKTNDTSGGYQYQTKIALAHLVLLMIGVQQLCGIFW